MTAPPRKRSSAGAGKPIATRLHHASDDAPGIRRIRSGRGFRYRTQDDRPVRDQETLDRIRSLAIPPAYREVWICGSPHGHLQATGRDARGRKQYRYHPAWRCLRDDCKFDRVTDFAGRLPRLRRALRRDLALPGIPREKVLALLVRIMSATLLRVGNAEYVRENGSFGLTTLHVRHARFRRNGLRLRFPGKSGRTQEIEIEDPRIVRLMRHMHQLPGQALFQYRDPDGRLQAVDSSMVNAYLRECMGEDFSAKDFRTWGATLVAFRMLAATPLPEPPEERALATVERHVVDGVAALLGNTAAVCRKSYIDPRLFAGWRAGRLEAAAGLRSAGQWEKAALRFLVRAHRAEGKKTR